MACLLFLEALEIDFMYLCMLNELCSFWLKVEHSTLTHGARALAKHAERSSSKYWGSIDGNGEQLLVP